jgi:Zn-dependent M28 family amino/carboxypeptidase
MFARLTAFLAASFLLAAAPAAAQRDAPVTARQLMRHIEMLASDAFQGREPGTEGERLATGYIRDELRRRGVEPAGPDGSWFQPVALIRRRALAHQMSWSSGGRRLDFDLERVSLAGSESEVRLADAPVVFVGHGLVDPAHGIDQLEGVDLRGAVALVLIEAPDVRGFPAFVDRARAVAAAGAAAVIAVAPDEVPWQALAAAGRAPATELAEPLPRVTGVIPLGEVVRLVRESGGDFEAMLNERAGPSFHALPLNLAATLQVSTEVRRYSSNNVVGRIRGTGRSGEAVLLMGHWDHLGLCRPEGAADRICNGAVDNASGIAVLIEVAGRLARRRPARDVIVLATTSEEAGLLGAEHFAAHPVVPLDRIVAALNIDTAAIAGRGAPVAVVGRGVAELDAAIAATAAALGRPMDVSFAADAYAGRQDGWILSRAGVPAALVGGAFADVAALEAFLAGRYHSPDDEAGPDLPLGGAAEDADLLVALARRLADPSLYRRGRPSAPGAPTL